MSPAVASAESALDIRLSLASEFELLVGTRCLTVPRGVQRLLALLAIPRRPIQRFRVAGQLWPDGPEWRALGNLRSVLWRLRHIPGRMVRSTDDRLALDPVVHVDVM